MCSSIQRDAKHAVHDAVIGTTRARAELKATKRTKDTKKAIAAGKAAADATRQLQSELVGARASITGAGGAGA